ncbi:MAG: hypothetical protein H7067_08145 [Burkholderiales bacterium]|nr:hypothetical protein [Opitutaceae bacterium]
MQDKSALFSAFSARTEALAAKLGVRVIDLPGVLGFSLDMLTGYRSGRYPISIKAWRKLESAEAAAGIAKKDVAVHTEIASDASAPMSEVIARLRAQAAQLIKMADDLEGMGRITAGGDALTMPTEAERMSARAEVAARLARQSGKRSISAA